MTSSLSGTAQTEQEMIDALGPWFHNLHLPSGRQTAPDHALGDFPREKWISIAEHIPADLSGWSALDVGCNAGFYSFELARRGAEVTGIDHDEHYLRQARWAAQQYGVSEHLSFRRLQVYQLAQERTTYDIVWFMGVFYHLRYPLLALDILARKTRRMMVFQTMTMPGEEVLAPPEDVRLDERHCMTDPGWPKMAFIEQRVANDPTNWWAPNHACVEAMLRTANLEVIARPSSEIYICRPSNTDPQWAIDLKEQEFRAATQQ